MAGGAGQRSRGFTLLEVMVALVVLTVAITAFLEGIAQNVRLEATNAETMTALNAATRTLEDIKSKTFGEVTQAAVGGTFEATMVGNDGKTVKLTNAAGSTQVGTVTVSDTADPRRRVIEAVVTWRSVTGGRRTLSLMTEVTDY